MISPSTVCQGEMITVRVADTIILIQTKISNKQKYVNIGEPSLDEFLNAGQPSVTPHCENKRKLNVSVHDLWRISRGHSTQGLTLIGWLS